MPKSLSSRVKHLPPLNDTLGKMIAKGWLGRKSGKGFYEYGSGGDGKINAQLGDLQSAEPATVNEGDLRDRLVLSMVNEAARTIEEKVVDSSRRRGFWNDHGNRVGAVPRRSASIRRSSRHFNRRQPVEQSPRPRGARFRTLPAFGRHGEPRRKLLPAKENNPIQLNPNPNLEEGRDERDAREAFDDGRQARTRRRSPDVTIHRSKGSLRLSIRRSCNFCWTVFTRRFGIR